MKKSPVQKIVRPVGDGPHAIMAVYCKLFSDTVTAKICLIRKRELNGSGGFSCFGCTMEKG